MDDRFMELSMSSRAIHRLTAGLVTARKSPKVGITTAEVCIFKIAMEAVLGSFASCSTAKFETWGLVASPPLASRFSLRAMTILNQNFTLRLDVDLKQRVERRCVEMNAQREAYIERGGTERAKVIKELASTAFTMSDVIRRALVVGLDVLEGDEDAIRDWAGPMIESDLKRILAAGYHDSEVMKLLRRIASENAPDPDFG
jgi:hypothetical protein